MQKIRALAANLIVGSCCLLAWSSAPRAWSDEFGFFKDTELVCVDVLVSVEPNLEERLSRLEVVPLAIATARRTLKAHSLGSIAVQSWHDDCSEPFAEGTLLIVVHVSLRGSRSFDLERQQPLLAVAFHFSRRSPVAGEISSPQIPPEAVLVNDKVNEVAKRLEQILTILFEATARAMITRKLQ